MKRASTVVALSLVFILAALAARVSNTGSAPEAPSDTLRCQAATPRAASAPSFSSDGLRLAFATPADSGHSLFSVGVDGRGLRRLGSVGAPVRQTSWSPEGRRLAFVLADGSIHLLDLNSGDRRMVAPAPSTSRPYAELGGWTPEGRFLVYARGRQRAAGEALPQATIHVHDTSSGTTRALVVGADPATSPDGGRLAFTGVGGADVASGSPTSAVKIISFTGAGERQVSNGPDSDPVWSPDGRRIAFSRKVDVAPEVRVIRADGASPASGRTVGRSSAPLSWRQSALFGTTLIRGSRGVQAVGAINPDATPPRTRMLTAPAPFATRFAAATRKGGTIAYVVRSAGTSLPLGLRLASASGTNDRTLLPCNGTPGDDQMLGTVFADRMNSLAGADRIESGAGDDRIHGGTDRDLVFAGIGNDFVSVRGGASDTVDCGPGRDRVIADGRDVVADDCEAVQR